MSDDIREVTPLEHDWEERYRVKAVDRDSRGSQENFREDLDHAEEEEQKEKHESGKHESSRKDEAKLLESDRVIISGKLMNMPAEDQTGSSGIIKNADTPDSPDNKGDNSGSSADKSHVHLQA